MNIESRINDAYIHLSYLPGSPSKRRHILAPARAPWVVRDRERQRLRSAHDPRERIHRRIQTHKWTEPRSQHDHDYSDGGGQTQKRRAACSCKESAQRRTKSARTKHRRITERRACRSASPAPCDRSDRSRARRSRRRRATPTPRLHARAAPPR